MKKAWRYIKDCWRNSENNDWLNTTLQENRRAEFENNVRREIYRRRIESEAKKRIKTKKGC